MDQGFIKIILNVLVCVQRYSFKHHSMDVVDGVRVVN